MTNATSCVPLGTTGPPVFPLALGYMGPALGDHDCFTASAGVVNEARR
jgi:hypothetical protein